MPLKKVYWGCKLEQIKKTVTSENQYAKTTEDEKVHILYKCLYPNSKTI